MTAYAAGESATSVAGRFGYTVSGVLNYVRRNGGSVRDLSSSNRRRDLNDECFDTWNEESMYFAGLLAADGYITDRANNFRVSLTLAEKDKEVIERCRTFLGTTRGVTVLSRTLPSGTPARYHQLTVSSRKLFDRLRAAGLRNNNQSRVVEELADSRHFWRGVVDGDGCVQFKGRTGKSAVLSLVGGRALLEQFASFAGATATGTVAEVSPHKSIWRVSLRVSTSLRVMESLYRNCSVSLDRKRKFALQILAEYSRRAADRSAAAHSRRGRICATVGCPRPVYYSNGRCKVCYIRMWRQRRRGSDGTAAIA